MKSTLTFAEIQQKFNDVDSIQHGKDPVLVLIRSSSRLLEFDIKDLCYDENEKQWYIEVEP